MKTETLVVVGVAGVATVAAGLLYWKSHAAAPATPVTPPKSTTNPAPTPPTSSDPAQGSLTRTANDVAGAYQAFMSLFSSKGG